MVTINSAPLVTFSAICDTCDLSMEDLYGKTISKSVTPLELAKSATVRSTNFASLTGRITPVETNNKSARQQSAFSGNQCERE